MSLESASKGTVVKKVASNLHIMKLSMLYFAVGMVMFLVAMVSAVWVFPESVQFQSMRNPNGWFLAHILLLGWATTVVMGASFQLVQVIMRTSLFSRSMGYIQFVLYTLGYLAMITGFLVGEKLIVIGGTSVAVSALLYVINMAITFILKKEWNVFVFGVSLSIIALLITISLGIRLGLAFAYEGYTGYYEMTLGSHLWFGIAGNAYWIMGGYHAGVWLQAIALWSEKEWIAVVALVCMLISLGWF
ncbi:MAG: hypothetical protein WD424_08235, partial [Paenibacillaceae bacterium]